MTALTDAAATELQAREAEEAAAAAAAEEARLAAEAAAKAAADAARKALRTAALDAVRATLVRQDGTTLTLSQAGLSAIYTDLAHGLVVVSDTVVNLAAVRDAAGVWSVRLAVSDEGDDRWRPINPDQPPLKSLADLGAALKAQVA